MQADFKFIAKQFPEIQLTTDKNESQPFMETFYPQQNANYYYYKKNTHFKKKMIITEYQHNCKVHQH